MARPVLAGSVLLAVLGPALLVGTTSAAFRDDVAVEVDGLYGELDIAVAVDGDCADPVQADDPEAPYLVLARDEAVVVKRVPSPITQVPDGETAEVEVMVCNIATLAGDLSLSVVDRTPEGQTSPFSSLVFDVSAGGESLTGVPVGAAALNSLNDGRGVLLPEPVVSGASAGLSVRVWMVGDAPRDHALQPVDVGIQVSGESRPGETITLEGVVR